MTIFTYPPIDDVAWPTLGPQVCDFIEAYLCYGPGDLLGLPVKLNKEQRAWIYRMYEVEPETLKRRKNGVVSKSKNPRAGRRRFTRCALSLPKGSAKTELAAWIAACELHAEAPVRCDGFTQGRPIGRPVIDPYIPMIAYTEEQTEELAYGALRRILEECEIGEDFDIGLERIVRLTGDGKAEAVAGSPNARDGARTTFEHADETHRFTLDSLKRGWTVMLANLAKRPIADPWALETTTAPEPGGGSVAESTMLHAEQLAKEKKTSRLFFFHRQAADNLDISKPRSLRKAIREARGPYVSKWSDIDGIAELFDQPDADLAYLERVWTNRRVQGSERAFDVQAWRKLKKRFRVANGELITLGFDGSRYEDATAIVATHIESGHQWPIGIWERGPAPNWEVPVAEVDAAVQDAFERWNVARMYCDPPRWESWLAKWAGEYGDKIVVEWWTNRRKPMAYAIRAFIAAIAAAEISHDGDERVAQHLGNSCKYPTNLVDAEGRPLWLLRKERPDSPNKIDAAMASILSWEARNDAIQAGALSEKPSVYESRGLLTVGAE